MVLTACSNNNIAALKRTIINQQYSVCDSIFNAWPVNRKIARSENYRYFHFMLETWVEFASALQYTVLSMYPIPRIKANDW